MIQRFSIHADHGPAPTTGLANLENENAMRLLITSLLAAHLLALPLAADAAEQAIQLTATVPSFCTINGSDTPAAVVQDLTVGADGRVSTSPVNFTFPVSCNKPASMVLASDNRGLTGPEASANFANKITYIAAVSGAFPSVLMNTAINAPSLPGGGSPYATASASPVDGDLYVTVTPATTSAPLAAGTYNDTLRLTITPLQ